MADALRALSAVAAAMLPRRYWDRLEAVVPVSNAVFAASALTLFAGTALGITGFMAHLEAVTSRNNELYLDVAPAAKSDYLPVPSGLSGLSLFTFVLLTPQGWISTYLTLSGVVRMVGVHTDDPHGDLLLTAVDAGVHTAVRARSRKVSEDHRHRLEGPRVRDRVVIGSDVGLPRAELVVISSRIKEDWEPGAVVLSDQGEFRITAVEDRTIDGRLRRLYSLARHTDLEAIRRTVRYAFPRTERRQ